MDVRRRTSAIKATTDGDGDRAAPVSHSAGAKGGSAGWWFPISVAPARVFHMRRPP
jgi:hypothetical protein